MTARIDDFDRRYYLVREIINRYDPAGLYAISDETEYACEVKGVLKVVLSAGDQRNLRDRVQRIFDQFGTDCFPAARWDELAAELWQLRSRPNW